jgi:NitT/TauT family transport system substrate-binding protein
MQRGISAFSKTFMTATVLLTAAACGSSAASQSDAANSGTGKTTLVVSSAPIADLAAIYVAQQQGYFAEHGLTVKFSTAGNNGGATLLPELQSNAIQVAAANFVSIIQNVAQGYPVRCIAAVIRKPANGGELELLASPKDHIKTAADLAGKTIAVNTLANVNQLIADAWLSSHGVNPASVHFVAVAFPQMPQVLKSGQVAAAITDEPFSTLSRQAGATVLDPHPYHVIAQAPVFNCWAATSSFIKAHSQAIRGFTEAMQEANTYIPAHLAAFRQLLVKSTKLSPGLVKQVTLPAYTTQLTAADVQAWEAPAIKYGLLKKNVPASQVIASP